MVTSDLLGGDQIDIAALIDACRRDKETRHAVMMQCLRWNIAAQIRALRHQRGWSQTELATRSGLAVSTIIRYEAVEETGFHVRKLEAIARAFDVALIIRFEAWSAFFDDLANLAEDDIAPLSWEKDVLMGERGLA